jgi:hypothetical protein
MVHYIDRYIEDVILDSTITCVAEPFGSPNDPRSHQYLGQEPEYKQLS